MIKKFRKKIYPLGSYNNPVQATYIKGPVIPFKINNIDVALIYTPDYLKKKVKNKFNSKEHC